MNELISIIIPVYNTEKYLKKCLDSVISQSYTNIEIIIVNDGSTDNSYEICQEYKKKDKRIKVIDKSNGGLSDARNVGIKNSKGKFLGFVDSDDFIEKDMYGILYSEIKKTKANIACCEMTKKNVIKNNRKIEKKILKRNEAIHELLSDKKINNYVCNKLFSRELFTDIKFPLNRKFEDLATTHLLIDKSDLIVYINYIGYHYIQREGSITKSYSEKYLEDYTWAIQKFVKDVLEKHSDFQKEIELMYTKGIVNVFSACTKARLYEYYNQENMNNLYKEFRKLCKKNGVFVSTSNLDIKHKLFAILLLLNKKMAYKVGANI